MGIGCSTWDVVAAEDCRAKMVECSKFIKWHIDEVLSILRG